jgi:mannose-6-phosphate isomerase-like protein (cupin superfamily)
MWRQQEGQEEIVALESGVCLTIPLGTHFQFRAFRGKALTALGVTMPPWPGAGDAVSVQGKWEPTVP